MSRRAGERIGGCTVVRMIGRGGMGEVYEATTDGGARVAIKTLRAPTDGSDELRERFRREGEVARSVRHPNVVEVLEAGEDDGELYLTMEFLSGPTLKEHVIRRRAEGRPLDGQEAIALLLPIFDAVMALHEPHHIVHRDIKPQNIVLAATDGASVPKLLDFGIARAASGSDLTVTGALLGSPGYMSPEQCADTKHVGPASDQYALGAVLFFTLTGELPVAGAEQMELVQATIAGRVRPLRAVLPGAPAGLEEVVARALKREPGERYRSVREFRAVLGQLAAGDLAVTPADPSGTIPYIAQSLAATTPPSPPIVIARPVIARSPEAQADRPTVRPRWLLIAAPLVGLLVVAGVVFAVVQHRRHGDDPGPSHNEVTPVLPPILPVENWPASPSRPSDVTEPDPLPRPPGVAAAGAPAATAGAPLSPQPQSPAHRPTKAAPGGRGRVVGAGGFTPPGYTTVPVGGTPLSILPDGGPS